MVEQLLDALIGGAAAVSGMGGKVVVEKAVADAYGSLKGALAGRLGAESDAVEAVAKLDAKPDSEARRAVVREEITTAAVSDDPDLLAAARRLLAALDALPAEQRATVQQAFGSNINQASGGSSITMTNTGE